MARMTGPRGLPPLDLQAVEANVSCSCGWATHHPTHVADTVMLLAHVRALRAALRDAPVPAGYSWNSVRATMLALARDEEATREGTTL